MIIEIANVFFLFFYIQYSFTKKKKKKKKKLFNIYEAQKSNK